MPITGVNTTVLARVAASYLAILGIAFFTVDHAGQFAVVAAIVGFMAYRDYVRRSTLRRRDDGRYVWIEWTGGERCSLFDPSEPGGEWDSDCDGDGGGD